MSRPVETLSEALGFVETVLEVGHSHPGVRRVLAAAGSTASFLVSLDDERISDLEVEIGIGVAIPDRAIWLRTLASEVARMSDHFARLAAVSAAIGLPAAESIAQRGEVEAARLLEAITGGGPFAGWVRLGGVAGAPADGFAERWHDSNAALLSILAGFEAVAVDNPSCQQRLRDVASFSIENCITWGVTGPTLRAAGMPMDVRRDSPYLAYGVVDFDVPIGENGDDFDRLLVVVEEIRQSLRIVEQCQSLLASL